VTFTVVDVVNYYILVAIIIMPEENLNIYVIVIIIHFFIFYYYYLFNIEHQNHKTTSNHTVFARYIAREENRYCDICINIIISRSVFRSEGSVSTTIVVTIACIDAIYSFYGMK